MLTKLPFKRELTNSPDDAVQGILFSRSPVVDLSRYNRREKALRRMRRTRDRLQGWLTKPQSLSPLAPEGPGKEFVVVRRGKHRQTDLEELSSRLRPASSDF